MILTIYTQAPESEGGRGYNRERRRSSLAKILTPPREFLFFFTISGIQVVLANLSKLQSWAIRRYFRKSQIRKFADLNNLLYLRTFRKSDPVMRICQPNLLAICGLKTSASPQIHTLSP